MSSSNILNLIFSFFKTLSFKNCDLYFNLVTQTHLVSLPFLLFSCCACKLIALNFLCSYHSFRFWKVSGSTQLSLKVYFMLNSIKKLEVDSLNLLDQAFCFPFDSNGAFFGKYFLLLINQILKFLVVSFLLIFESNIPLPNQKQ